MQLTSDFLNELIRLTFLKKGLIEVMQVHFKFNYVPVKLKEHKVIIQSVLNYYKVNGKLPTFGIISQQHSKDDKIQALLAEIKDTPIADLNLILNQLEEYIKKIRFQILMKQTAEIYNEGRVEESMKLLEDESSSINNFSLKKDSGQFSKIFGGFEDRRKQRNIDSEAVSELKSKIPFGIKPLDEVTYGGIDKTETVLWILRSGTGKSTALRWGGFHAAILGYNVLHIQAEGSVNDVEIKYDQMWTKSIYSEIKTNNFTDEKKQKYQKFLNQMKTRGRDILVTGFEKFDDASMKDVRDLVIDYYKEVGVYPDLIILDYIELFHPGDGQKYGTDTQSLKIRLTNASRKLKNICLEFGSRAVTACQTSDIEESLLNDPSWVIKRGNAKGDKNLVESYSYVFTGTQTSDEYGKDVMRLYVDKLRNYKAGQIFRIKTEYNFGRFYKNAEVEEEPEKISGKSFKDARKKIADAKSKKDN